MFENYHYKSARVNSPHVVLLEAKFERKHGDNNREFSH
jgi:hypothetical protein